MLERFTTKQKIIFLLTALVALIFLSSLFGYLAKKSDEKVIDYSNITSENIVNDSSIYYNKIVFYELQDVIDDFINAYSSEEKNSYESYYESLTSEYRKYLSKNKYKEKVIKFYDKFECTDTVDTGIKMCTDGILKEVYEFDTNKYICRLESFNKNEAYIGIKLIENVKEPYAQIFYIE